MVAVGARLAYNGTAGFGLKLPPERLVHVDASSSNLNAVYPASDVAAISAEAFFALPESRRSPADRVDPGRPYALAHADSRGAAG